MRLGKEQAIGVVEDIYPEERPVETVEPEPEPVIADQDALIPSR